MATERDRLVGLLEESQVGILGEHEFWLMRLDEPIEVRLKAMYTGLPIPLDLIRRALIDVPEFPVALTEIIHLCMPDADVFEDTGG